MDTLAVRLTIPPAGVVEDFHLQVNAPCWAHKRRKAQGASLTLSFFDAILTQEMLMISN